MNVTINNLSVQIRKTGNVILKNVALHIPEGEIVSLVGHSGSGKTTVCYSILNLLHHNFIITNGKILFDDMDLLRLSPTQMRQTRLYRIGFISQDPLDALNPLFTIEEQMRDIIKYTNKTTKSEQDEMIQSLLESVALKKNLVRIQKSYPHQLSGGIRQRAMIAMALIGNPEIIIADEPTSSLDVSTQAQIIQLLQQLNSKMKISILLITHNIDMALKISHQIAKIKDGEIEQKSLQTVHMHKDV